MYQDDKISGETRQACPGTYRNPSRRWRIILVAGVWSIPGTVAGMMLHLVVSLPGAPAFGLVAGAIVFGVLGGWLEAAD